jgi:hypothetical protein
MRALTFDKFSQEEIGKLEALLALSDASAGSKGGSEGVDSREFEDLTGDGGVKMHLIKPGSGFHPMPLSKVQVHFVGKVQGGAEFHSTHASGHAVSFLLGTSQTIKGLEVALLAMRAGSRALVTIAPQYGYGNKGRAAQSDEAVVPPGATLEYEISLISFLAKPGTAASLASTEKANDLDRLRKARQGRDDDDAPSNNPEQEQEEEEFPALGGKKSSGTGAAGGGGGGGTSAWSAGGNSKGAGIWLNDDECCL